MAALSAANTSKAERNGCNIENRNHAVNRPVGRRALIASPAGVIPRLRGTLPAELPRGVPPALSLRAGFSRLVPEGQPIAVVSAMNRSGRATSSSINHRSGSNRRRFCDQFAHRIPALRAGRRADRLPRYAPSRQARARGRRRARRGCAMSRTSAPRSGSPRARIMPNPPSVSARRTRLDASSPRRQALVHHAGAIAGEARQRDVRAQEGAGAARAFLAARIDDPRLGDEHPAAARDPAPLGARLARPHRLGEMQVERGGQQEAVADQAVGGVESGIVEHLEIERAMRRAGGVEGAGVDGEVDLAAPRFGQGRASIRTSG